MIRLLGSLVVAVLCFYYGVIYQNAMIITIAYAIVLLAGVSVLEVVFLALATKCRMEVWGEPAESEKPFSLSFHMTNKSPFSIGKMEFRVGIQSTIFHRKDFRRMSVLEGKPGTNTYTFDVVISGAGRYEITASYLYFTSFTGMFRAKKKIRECREVLLLPQIHALNMEITEGVKNFLGDADCYDEFRPGHDAGEIFEVRKYRQKDRLQSIHWKMSAKMDELMVRESSLPRACAIVLLLDAKKTGTRSEEEKLRAYLELAVSISFGLTDRKIPHYVAWMSRQSGDIRRIRVDDDESFSLFLMNYLQDGVDGAKEDIRKRYRDKYKNEIYYKDICINTNLEIYQNGEYLAGLDAKKMKDACEELELLL